MSDGEDAPGPQRRATDGLDWRLQEQAPAAAGLEERAAPAAGGEEETVLPAAVPMAAAVGRRSQTGRAGIALLGAVAGVAALVGGLVGGVVAWQLDGGGSNGSKLANQATPVRVEQTSAVAEAAAKARASVLRIESTRSTRQGVEQDVGSGVMLDRSGHIITNAHVVLGTESLKVILPDGSSRSAILVGDDYPFTDLAVLQIGPVDIPPMAAGDSGALVLGQTVIAIGNPLAEFNGSITVGVISGLNRVRIFDAVRQDDLIQTDAALNSGNSGGALVNLNGELVGMPTAVLRQSQQGEPVEGIGFALPSKRILAIAQGIIQAGGSYPRPDLGADFVDITPDVLARIHSAPTDKGAIIGQVAPGGAAAGAGIQPGDIITRVGDRDVTPDEPLLNALAAFEPGQAVRVVLNRDGRIIEAEVRLAKRT